MQQGSENELLGIAFYTYLPTTRSTDQGSVSDLNTIYELANVTGWYQENTT
jgi:hypothetical protein